MTDQNCYICKHEPVCYMKRDSFSISYEALCKVFNGAKSTVGKVSTDAFCTMLAENCKWYIKGETNVR